MKYLKIPKDFECPILHEVMVDPVFTADGDSYERNAIEKWLKDHDTNPKTNLRLEHKKLVSNKQLKSQISSFVDMHKKEFETELFEAAATGDDETLGVILKLGIHVDTIDEKGWSGLHHAAFAGKAGTAEFLLAHGTKNGSTTANYDDVRRFPTQIPETPNEVISNLHLKLLSIEVELSQITFLCNECYRIKPVYKGSMNSSESSQHAKDTTNYELTSIKNTLALFQQINQQMQFGLMGKEISISINKKIAVIESNIFKSEREFQSLLAFYSNYRNSRSEDRIGQMNHFLSSLRDDVVAQLTRLKQALVEIKNAAEKQQAPEEYRPLLRKLAAIHLAVISGNAETVKTVLNQLNSKETLLQGDTQAWTPLHWAAYSGNLAIVTLLLEKNAPLNCQDIDGLSPLHIAVYQHAETIIDYFIQQGADIKMLDKQEESPIALAKRMEKKQLAQSMQQMYRQRKQEIKHKSEATIVAQAQQIARLEEQLNALFKHVGITVEPKSTNSPSITNVLAQTLMAPPKELPSVPTPEAAVLTETITDDELVKPSNKKY